MDAYDNETFWAELIERLSERDLVAKHGQQAIENMTVEERFTNLEEFESAMTKNLKRTESNGSRLKVIEDGRLRSRHVIQIGGF